MSERALTPENEHPLGGFAQAPIRWLAWLAPSESEANVDWVTIFGPGRAASAAFRLSARDVEVGKGIAGIEDSIYNKAPEGGLERGYRELGALVTSRLNGCLFCAAHHSMGTVKFLGGQEGVTRILEEGVESEQSPEWRVVADAAISLTRTPMSFGAGEINALRGIGFDDGMILDLIHSVAYFNSANRFLLSLGETTSA